LFFLQLTMKDACRQMQQQTR